MSQTTGEIATFLGGELRGPVDVVIDSVAQLKSAGPKDLSYAE